MKECIGTSVRGLKPERSHRQAGAIAGLTFAVVNVPQAMVNAYLATVIPVLGIYTLMVAVPFGAVFASSMFMNISTAGALSVAAGDGLAGVPLARRTQALAVTVSLVGLFQLNTWLFRLGSSLRFISKSVMIGFLNSVTALIILGQLNELTGFENCFPRSVPRG